MADASRNAIKSDLARIFAAAIAAVDPSMLVARALDGIGDGAAEIPSSIAQAHRVFVLAIGKAALAMASAIENRLGPKIADGLAVVPSAQVAASSLTRVRIVAGGHPVPDRSSVEAADAALALARIADAGDLVIVALSGGASAMLCAPADGLTLDDKIAVTSAMLKSGATIREFNLVRKHLSVIKGGRLAVACAPARMLTLVLSDVPGNDLATIGSGPTAPDPATFGDAIAVLKRRGIWGRAPERVREHLERGMAGEIAETPKSGDPVFAGVSSVIIGDNATAIAAAADEAARAGYRVQEGRAIQGEADDAGRAAAVHLAGIMEPRTCVIAGGEPVVTVRGGGLGGRAQHCALAAAIEMAAKAPNRPIGALFAGSDGIDGPTDAAGGFVFPDTVARAESKGRSASAALSRNDSYSFLDAAGDLFKTGPTGTNVSDLFIGIVND